MTGCPVLQELEATEAYDPEYEQVPVLSGGDYDITAIRDCGETCVWPAYASQRLDRLRALARRLGLAGDDTAHIETALKALIASRDEWRDKAIAGAARIEELTKEAARMNLALCRIVNGDGTVAGMKAIARDALDGKP